MRIDNKHTMVPHAGTRTRLELNRISVAIADMRLWDTWFVFSYEFGWPYTVLNSIRWYLLECVGLYYFAQNLFSSDYEGSSTKAPLQLSLITSEKCHLIELETIATLSAPQYEYLSSTFLD